jgi:hypothetical protein
MVDLDSILTVMVSKSQLGFYIAFIFMSRALTLLELNGLVAEDGNVTGR